MLQIQIKTTHGTEFVLGLGKIDGEHVLSRVDSTSNSLFIIQDSDAYDIHDALEQFLQFTTKAITLGESVCL